MARTWIFLLLAGLIGCSRSNGAPAATAVTTATVQPYPELAAACNARGLHCKMNHYRDGDWQAVADDDLHSLNSNQWMCTDKVPENAIHCLIGKLGKPPDWPMIDQVTKVN